MIIVIQAAGHPPGPLGSGSGSAVPPRSRGIRQRVQQQFTLRTFAGNRDFSAKTL
jgi:hypothetical protein